MLWWFEKLAPIRRKFDAITAFFVLIATLEVVAMIITASNNSTILAITALNAVFIAVLMFAKERICRPYVETVVRMEELAAGRLDAPIAYTDHEDCVGRMTVAMQTFRDNAARLLWNSTHNQATNLLNMEGLRAGVPALIDKARRERCSLVVGIVDLDNLKLVNDTLGHSVGDVLIIEAARRLEAAFDDDALVARLGGDEFVFVEACSRTETERAARLKNIEASLCKPCLHEGRLLDTSASFGVIIEDPENADFDTLLQSADLAMYGAKEAGKRGHAFFSGEMQVRAEQRAANLDLARLALGSKLVVPYFQPQVSLRSGNTIGYEALLRVQIGNNILLPASVEHAFDNCDLATRLGDEMLRKVLEQMRAWRRANFDFGSVALNASAAELLRPDYAERVLNALNRAEIDPACLEIEVTEGVLLGRGAERCAETLEVLRSHRVSIALDDFGTGFASLTHIKSLPITKLKIDRSFVQDLTESAFDAAIVQSLVQLAHAKGLAVVAEGVETYEQAEILRQYGCPIAQGFLFGAAIVGGDVAFCHGKAGQVKAISGR